MFASFCLLTIGAMLAQPESGWGFERYADQGTEDVGLLNDSLRLVPYDMRLPDDWGQLYRMDSQFGPLYARRAGGITAVFPESTYAGSQALVPPDTVFVIGDPSPSLLRQLGLAVGDDNAIVAPAPNRLNSGISTAIDGRLSTAVLPTRMDTSIGVDVSEPVTRSPASVIDRFAEAQTQRDVSMWYNDHVRQHRIEMLLDRALRSSAEH